jgi:hypothetical protein
MVAIEVCQYALESTRSYPLHHPPSIREMTVERLLVQYILL